VAYEAREGPKAFLVYAGVKTAPEYDDIAEGPTAFSPDGKRLVCLAIKDAKVFVVAYQLDGPNVVNVRVLCVDGNSAMDIGFSRLGSSL